MLVGQFENTLCTKITNLLITNAETLQKIIKDNDKIENTWLGEILFRHLKIEHYIRAKR